MALRVLFPLDGSDRSTEALDRALGMLDGPAELDATLLVVVQEGFEDVDKGTVEMFASSFRNEIFPTVESGEKYLDRAEEICARHGIEPSREVVIGTHYEAILEASTDHDLVVMHSLDPNQIGEALRMSQTEELARAVDASVLLIED